MMMRYYNDMEVTPFAAMRDKWPADFGRIFGDMEAQQVDEYARIKYGHSPIMAGDDDVLLSCMMAYAAMHLAGWRKQAAALAAEYDIVLSENTERTITEEVNTTTSDNGQMLSATKAFNDTDFTDGDRDQSTSDGTRHDTRTRTETAKGQGKTPTADILEEINLRRWSLAQEVMAAMVKEITLDIYV